jgi:hypothetical protein
MRRTHSDSIDSPNASKNAAPTSTIYHEAAKNLNAFGIARNG